MKTFRLTTIVLALAAAGCGGASAGKTAARSTAPASTTAPTTSSTSTGTSSTGTSSTGTSSTGTSSTGTSSTGTSSTGTSTTPTPTPGQQTVDSSDPTNPHMVYALALINQSRAQYGLPPVALDKVNGPCALRHAQDVWACANGQLSSFSMCAHGDFKQGDRCNCLAENQGVGMGDNDDAFAAVHQQMMNEGPPPAGTINHFWVITNPNYKTVALGEFVDPNGTVWISEEWK